MCVVTGTDGLTGLTGLIVDLSIEQDGNVGLQSFIHELSDAFLGLRDVICSTMFFKGAFLSIFQAPAGCLL